VATESSSNVWTTPPPSAAGKFSQQICHDLRIQFEAHWEGQLPPFASPPPVATPLTISRPIIIFISRLHCVWRTDRPRFRCRRSHGAEFHASNVSVVCVLHHNPDPSELYVTWHRGGPHRLHAGNSYGGDYRLSKSVGINENEQQRQYVQESNSTVLLVTGPPTHLVGPVMVRVIVREGSPRGEAEAGGDVKSVSQLQAGCAASRPLWCIKGPRLTVSVM